MLKKSLPAATAEAAVSDVADKLFDCITETGLEIGRGVVGRGADAELAGPRRIRCGCGQRHGLAANRPAA